MNVIRDARKAQRMTQKEMAQRIGVTQGAVSQWEKGMTYPSIVLLPKISSVLNISVDEIVQGATDGETSLS